MTGFIAVHCGAGEHKEHNYLKYNKLSKSACKKAIDILNQGGNALDAVKAAVMVLEDNPITNAGIGSNLNTLGIIEMDASVMNGKNLQFGGCGAVRNIKNPVALAYDICVRQAFQLPLGLIPPNFLVGSGALKHAKESGIKTISNKRLITEKSYKRYKKYMNVLKSHSNIISSRMDTVGAVCVDNEGHVASACSSGGLLLKRPGRVGQAGLYASGVWADSYDIISESSIAVSTTGAGEHLVQTQLAKEIGNDLKSCTCPITKLSKTMTDKFLNSRHLANIRDKMGGALVLHVQPNGDGEILWGHSTVSMSIGYMKSTDKKAQAMISTLPQNAIPGSTITVGGHSFSMKD